jgi:peptide/nickel transport system substrate-binding protein
MRIHTLLAAFVVTLLSIQPGAVLAQTAAQAPVRGGTLTVALFVEPTQLNSAIDTTQQVKVVAGKIFSGLVKYDLNMKLQPDLATSWSVSKDGKKITFNLRKGVKWHDGQPFTSADVAFSVMKGFGQYNGLVRAVFSNVERVDTPDADTAVIIMKEPAAAIMNSLPVATATILPKHIYENTDIRQNPANQKPIGTGPFRFVEWQRGSSIVLERNPDYFEKGKPYLDRIVFRVIPDTQSRGAALEAGEVDVVFHSTAAASDARRLGALPNLELTTDGYIFDSTVAIMEINNDHPILGKPEVRRALAHVIDRKFILDNIWAGFGRVVGAPIHYTLKQAYTDAVPQYAYDPAMAEKLLDEAGYKRGADGTRFKVNIDFVPFGDGQHARTAQYVRQQLTLIGVQAEVRNTDFPTWVRRIWTTRDWDINTTAFTNGPDPSIGVQRAYWSKNIQVGTPFTNGTHYSNPEADKLFEQAAVEQNFAKRKAQFASLQKILATDLPVIPLVAIDLYTVVNKRVHNHSTLADGVYSGYSDVWVTGGK